MGLDFVRLDHAAKVYVASGNLPTYPQLLGNAAVVSDRLVEEDLFTSALVYRFVCKVREPRLGAERFMRPEISGVREEQLRHLDARGIVRRGSEVDFGDILVGKVSPRGTGDMTAEEIVLAAIFGGAFEDVMKDDSLLYHFRDRGIVCGTRLKARRRARCEQCGEVAAAATAPKVCPYCNGPVQTMAADDLPAGVQAQVVVEVLVRRELRVGDVLQDGKGRQLTVADIIPAGEMPQARKQRVDVLLGAGSTFHLHRKHVLRDPSESRATGRCEGRGDELRLEKLTVRFEKKCVARSTGAYGLISQMPVASGTRSGGQWVRMDMLQELWRQGYAMNALEMVSVKCDAIEGRKLAYEALTKGMPVALGAPETTRRFGTLLRALCHSTSFRTVSGEEKAFTDDDLGDVDALLVKGASRGDIKSWSYGEVKSPKMFNYRTYRPVEDGLFCERIFGPERDWECGCGRVPRHAVQGHRLRPVRGQGDPQHRPAIAIRAHRTRQARVALLVLPRAR